MSNAETPPFRYTAELAREIEARWQDFWEDNGTFHAPNPVGPLADQGIDEFDGKLYVLDMFPYPSGAGLHVGHPLGFIGTDVFARFQRMCGKNVLHAMGYDAFGLPAEQYAIRTGTHPRATTEANVANMRRQLRRLGLGHDARRSVSTTDEPFYRWTQWIFLKIFNSFYDEELDRARPIAELVAEFASGARSPEDARDWDQLDEGEQRRIIDGFRLAYVDEVPVNWCPGMGTVLANEEVTADGRSDIGNYPVFKRNMSQWTLRITAYADRLLADLDRLSWPEPIKVMQRNWIGRSEGAHIEFATDAGPIGVFTTRADTLFGATFMVLSPEHPLVDRLTTVQQAEAVRAYAAAAATATDIDRQAEDRPKTGVFLGSYATNPATGIEIPIWIADYVLMGYGTGAIMAVPSGDQRDFDFARQHGLEIRATQRPPDGWFVAAGVEPSLDCSTWPSAFVGEGEYVQSSNENFELVGTLSVNQAKAKIHSWLQATGIGEPTTTYRLRDWLFSRQRYWGEPFPILWDEHGPVALGEDDLPLLLPELIDFQPTKLDPEDANSTPVPPLGRATDWSTVVADLGDGPKTYRRELNVMPQWAGSCWYEMRYLDPTNTSEFVDPANENYWMGPSDALGDPGGVDLYVGGVEHAVLHLLYARFWHKVLFDLGYVSSEEPFRTLFNQGYIQAYAYKDARGQYVEAAEVVEGPDGFLFEGAPVTRTYGKMGKSLKNVVTPDEMYDLYGADTFRLYEMSMGPMDTSRPWASRDVVGMLRFLQRLWRNIVDEETGQPLVSEAAPDGETRRRLHQTIAAVRDDYPLLRFNTAIAKLIELNNHLTKRAEPVPREVAEAMTKMLAPICPHVAEELWSKLGHQGSIARVPFPVADERELVAASIELPVQVNGKVRSRIVVPADATAEQIEAVALADPKVAQILGEAAPRKVVVVPAKMVSVVL